MGGRWGAQGVPGPEDNTPRCGPRANICRSLSRRNRGCFRTVSLSPAV